MTSLLIVDGVSKHFRGLTALDRISFEVARGELLLIIGPNGAGKTTLFNVISGFTSAADGRVVLDGRDMRSLRPDSIVRRGIARTFQIPRPFKSLTVGENVEMARPSTVGAVFPALGRTPERTAEQVLRLVQLWPRRDDPAGTLSQGDLKLLEVARALAANPALLMLDEPYAGLGPGEMVRLTGVIAELHRAGLTLVIIEHKLRELMRLAQRVIVLHYGRKIADGTPAEISRNERVLEAYMGARGAPQHA
ncbi:MAG TPA: ABC transporter ATP-binding protein [Xanthobacteraceae bacterium]|jgi:branched-chain amino acid transport system ATP-binding protein